MKREPDWVSVIWFNVTGPIEWTVFALAGVGWVVLLGAAIENSGPVVAWILSWVMILVPIAVGAWLFKRQWKRLRSHFKAERNR